MAAEANIEICYLCGKPIADQDKRSVDHVPPKMLFPESLRRERNFSSFWTVPSHYKCNHGYSRDEEYFFYSLGLLCKGSTTGSHVAEKIIASTADDRRTGLHLKIRNEFVQDRQGRLRKTFDHDRIYRIARKIVRGLWYVRAGRREILSQDWRADFGLYDRNNRPPALIEKLMAENLEWGEYRDVFFFKAVSFTDEPAHAFMLVFWEWILITVTVHEPTCRCVKCVAPESRIILPTIHRS